MKELDRTRGSGTSLDGGACSTGSFSGCFLGRGLGNVLRLGRRSWLFPSLTTPSSSKLVTVLLAFLVFAITSVEARVTPVAFH